MRRFINSISITLLLIWGFSAFSQEVNFGANVTAGCAPLIVTFTDSTDDVALREWKFGNGNSSASTVNTPVSAIYSDPGTYEVTLIVNGDDSAKIEVVVFENPTATFNVPSQVGCPPFQVQFSDQSTGSSTIISWKWDFGDGRTSSEQNPSHTYQITGENDVLLTATDENGCFDTTRVNNYIEVSAAPNANFTADNNVACTPPLSVNYTNLSTGDGTLTYEWLFGDGNTSSDQHPNNNYTEETTYDVSLIVNDDTGCPDTLTKEDYVGLTSMLTGFEYSLQGCGPTSISFNDTSGPSPTSWSWSFPGGSPSSSSLPTPTVTYVSSGTKTVSLKATNQAGCEQTTQVDIEIDASPSASFSSNDRFSCNHRYDVSFNDVSSNASTWLWDFGDGDSSAEQHPIHDYYGSGSYNVSLTVGNSNGCTNTITFPSYVTIERPVADFSFDTDRGCIPLEVNFSDVSQTYFTEPITARKWSFFEGIPSTSTTGTSETVEYGLVDSFDVQLIVTTQSGCKDTLRATDTIIAGDDPVVDFIFDPTSACADSNIEFTNLSVGTNFYDWRFGDGGTSELSDPRHIYADTGYFSITLIAGFNGCADTVLKDSSLYIIPPIAKFNYSFDCDDPYRITFNDISIDAKSWKWQFGDDDSSSLQHPEHVYDSSGFARISLKVTNGACEHERLGLVILADPQAEFNVDSNNICKPYDPGLNDLSSDAVSWEWKIGESTSLNGQSPLNTMTNPGTFDAKLIITGANSCKDSITKDDFISVLGTDVDFSPSITRGCSPLEVDFTDLSDAPDGIDSYEWIFGDGRTSEEADPSHSFINPFVHYVTLSVVDNNGCEDSKIDFVNYILPNKPNNRILSPRDRSDICPGVAVDFVALVQVSEVVWDMGDSTFYTLSKDTSHIYVDTGVMQIIISGVNDQGCIGADTITLNSSKPDVQIITDTPLTADCPSPPLEVSFRPDGDADGSGTWLWNFGNGNLSIFKEASTSYSVAGDFDVSLKYTDANGCIDSVVYEDLIHISGPTGTFTFPDTSDCAPLEVQFEASATNTESFTWDFGDGTVLSNYSDSIVLHTYMSRGIRTPKLILNNGSCAWEVPSSATVDVSVIPLDVYPDVEVICPGESVPIQVTIIDTAEDFAPIDSIWWSPSNTLSNADALSTTATPDTSTNYVVIVRDINGCVGPDTVRILIDTIDVALGGKGGYCPGGFDTIIVDTSYSNNVGGGYQFAWSPSDGLSSTIIPNPIANPNEVTLYTLEISDTVCSITSTINVVPFTNPSLTVGEDFVGICYGLQDSLSVIGAATYIWSPALGLNDPSSSTPIVTTEDLVANKRDSLIITYQVIGTDGNKCKDTTIVNVKVRALPLIDTPQDTAVCAGDSVSISVDDSSNNYIWFPAERLSDSTGASVLATPQVAEFYNIIGVDQWGCLDTAGNVFVDVHELPELDYNGGGPLLKGQSVELLDLNGAGNYNYRWETSTDVDLPNTYVITDAPEETTFYEVFVATKTLPACTVTDTMTVIVYDRVELATPTAFTPNGDGENDVIYAYVKGVDLNTFTYRVYNRWGHIVFETNDPNIGWDGTRNGNQLEMDTYIIYVSGISLIGDPIEYKTDIALIR